MVLACFSSVSGLIGDACHAPFEFAILIEPRVWETKMKIVSHLAIGTRSQQAPAQQGTYCREASSVHDRGLCQLGVQ